VSFFNSPVRAPTYVRGLWADVGRNTLLSGSVIDQETVATFTLGTRTLLPKIREGSFDGLQPDQEGRCPVVQGYRVRGCQLEGQQ
jgi:hypothetical protein